MKLDYRLKVKWLICLNIGEPSSKPKYNIQAIAESTVKERPGHN
jgi:hypothetical protein